MWYLMWKLIRLAWESVDIARANLISKNPLSLIVVSMNLAIFGNREYDKASAYCWREFHLDLGQVKPLVEQPSLGKILKVSGTT